MSTIQSKITLHVSNWEIPNSEEKKTINRQQSLEDTDAGIIKEKKTL